MAHVVRTSVIIDGSRLKDTQFTHISLSQPIGWHHSFEIRLRQDVNKGVLADKAKDWIGKTISIAFAYRGDESLMLAPLPDVFKGIITSIGLARTHGTAELVVRGKSPTIVLDDGPHTRSFTEKGLQELIDEVLKKYKGAFPSSPKVKPKNFSKSLPYTVQYRESNYAFLARLANRYGEWQYYDGQNFYFGKPSGGDTIKLDFSENSLIDFDISLRAVPAKFEVKAYDYSKHEHLSISSSQKAATSDIGKKVMSIATSKIFQNTPSTIVNVNLDKGELKNLVERTEQVLTDEMVVLNGSSRNPGLQLGCKVEIGDKIVGEKYGTFVITNLNHEISQGGGYMNYFEAIPEEVETPPLTTLPEPPSCEMQLAKVTDTDDEKGLGRVKVKFAWQEGSSEKSPWLRVASPYTGKDKGFYIIPEVDDQVLVAFENNHPDKPYVLTGMYNGEAKPEWFEPKNRFKGFKSKAKNQWKFDDKNKSILLHAPSSITLSAGNKITLKTGGKDDSEILVDAGEGTINVKAKTINIEAAELVSINSQKDIEGKASNEISLEGTSSVKVKGTNTSVEGSAGVKVKGATVGVEGSGPVTVKGMPIKLN